MAEKINPFLDNSERVSMKEILSYVPVAGAGIEGLEMAKDVKEGKYKDAAVGGISALLGMAGIPPPVRKMIKELNLKAVFEKIDMRKRKLDDMGKSYEKDLGLIELSKELKKAQDDLGIKGFQPGGEVQRPEFLAPKNMYSPSNIKIQLDSIPNTLSSPSPFMNPQNTDLPPERKNLDPEIVVNKDNPFSDMMQAKTDLIAQALKLLGPNGNENALSILKEFSYKELLDAVEDLTPKSAN